MIKKILTTSMFPLVLLAATGATLTRFGGWSSDMAFTLAGVGSACIALSLLQPQRQGITPPALMLGLGLGGMLAGLAIDVSRVPVPVLESLCTEGLTRGFNDILWLHVQMLPAMHGLMFGGGLAAIPALRTLRPQCRQLCARLAQNTFCSAWMITGMTAGAMLATTRDYGGGTMSLSRMLGGMFVGMVWGMVISVSVYRLFFVARDKFLADLRSRTAPLNGKA